MLHWISEINLSYDAFRLFVWGLAILLLALLLTPILYFLLHGWNCRRLDILDSFSDAGAIYYLEQFHPSVAESVIEQVKETEQGIESAKEKAAAKEAEAGVKRAEAIALEKAGNKVEGDKLEAAARTLLNDAKRDLADAERNSNTARVNAFDYFKKYFGKEFSRKLFVLPLVILVLIAACLLSACSASLVYWREHNQISDDVFPLSVVLAIFGGYTWVVYDLIDRLRSYDYSPRTLLWSSFRLMIAAPVGFAFGRVFNETLGRVW